MRTRAVEWLIAGGSERQTLSRIAVPCAEGHRIRGTLGAVRERSIDGGGASTHDTARASVRVSAHSLRAPDHRAMASTDPLGCSERDASRWDTGRLCLRHCPSARHGSALALTHALDQYNLPVCALAH